MAKFPDWYYLDFSMCYDSRRQCLSQQGLTPLTSGGVPKPWQLTAIIGGVYEAPLSDSLRRGDPCPTLRFLFHSPCIWEKSCTPKKGTLFKMFLYGYIYILWNFQNNRFPYDFLKVVSVRHLSSTFSSLVSSHPQLHLILLTFLVFIKFFTDKEKRYLSFSFFTFILCLARLLKVLSELKVF